MITREESEAGLVAYEQVQAFAALRRRRMGLVYFLMPVIFVVMAVATYGKKMFVPAAACAGTGLFSAGVAWWNWRRLSAQDVENRALLASLHAKYGENLPWLEVERQMAEIRKIQAEQDASKL